MANVTFHVGSTAPPTTGLTIGGLYVNNTDGGIWYATGEDSRTEVGSWVTFTQSLTSGTKLGTIKINGNAKDLYCRNTLNTAGGTATNEKLFFVGMKSDNVASAQTYTNSYCYALGNHLYSNGYKCCTYLKKTFYGETPLPADASLINSSTTITAEELGGILVGYKALPTTDVGSNCMSTATLGVTIGVTTSGRGPSYKVGVTAKLAKSDASIRAYPGIEVYYIPFQ